MKYIFICTFLLIIQNSYGQKHNAEKITNATTSIFFDQTPYRGFKYQNVNYFIDDDLQTVVAMKNGKIIWKKNVVLECEKLKPSRSKIQGLKLHKGLYMLSMLEMIFGLSWMEAFLFVENDWTFSTSEAYK